MADEENAAPTQEGGGDEKKTKKRRNMFFAGVLLGVMLVEGVLAFVLIRTFAPGPAQAEAGMTEGLDGEAGEAIPQTVEVEVANFRAQNANSNSRNLVSYDVKVFASVNREDEEEFNTLLQTNQAKIQDRFSRVIRGAKPEILAQPELDSLRQEFQKELATIIKDDEIVKEVLLPDLIAYGP